MPWESDIIALGLYGDSTQSLQWKPDPCKHGGQELGSGLEKGCTLQLQLCAKLQSKLEYILLPMIGHYSWATALSPGTECIECVYELPLCMNGAPLQYSQLLHPLFSGHEMLHTL